MSRPVPTVVIGVGAAGIGILNAIHDVVHEAGYEEHYRFFALDSAADALDNLPDDVSGVQIEDDAGNFEDARDNYPYLNDHMEYGAEGAQRRRPVARYKIDSRSFPTFEDYTELINTDIIEDHYLAMDDKFGINRLNIFIVNSLSGGTGSGSFPMLAGIIDNKLKDLLSADLDVYMAGIGVVSEVKLAQAPEKGSFYPNTYAALNDVIKIASGEADPIPIYSYAEATDRGLSETPEELNVTGIFDNYWLVGLNEDFSGKKFGHSFETHVEQVDNSIAESVLTISMLREGKEHWATEEPVPGSLGEAEVSVPVQPIEDYLDQADEIDRKQTDLFGGRLPELYREKIQDGLSRQRRYESAQNALEDQIKSDKDTIIEAIVEEIDDFDRKSEIIEEVKDSVDLLGSGVRMFDPDESPEQAIDEIYDDLDNKLFDLAKLLMRDEVKDRIREHRVNVIEEYEETVNSLAGKERYDVPMDGTGGIKARLTTLEVEIGNEKDRIKSELEAVDWGTIKQVWEGLKTAVPLVNNEKEALENELREVKEDENDLYEIINLKENLEGMDEYIEEKDSTIRTDLIRDVHDLFQSKKDRDRNKEILTSERYASRLGYLPLRESKVESVLTEEYWNEEIDGLRDCLDELIRKEDFRNAVGTQITNSQPWDEQVTAKAGSPEMDEVAETWVLYSEENENLVEGAFDDADFHQEFYRSGPGGERDLGYIPDEFRVKFVSVYKTKDIETLRVYQQLHTLREKGELGRYLSNDSGYNDWREAFAYVEWYDQDIKQAFDIDITIELEKPPELDPDMIDMDGLESDRDEYVRYPGLYEYLWTGIHWARYEATEGFEGWEETLERETGIEKDHLRDLGPSLRKRNRWTKGTKNWAEILDAFREGFLQHGIEIDWKVPDHDQR